MKKYYTSELRPVSNSIFCSTGRKYRTLQIIILLFALSVLLSAQSINNPKQLGSLNDWQFLGLENEGITAIAVDWANPNTIYAGSGSSSSGTFGGIFKSIDAGASWDTLIRGVTVRDLDIHPINPQIIYATIGLNVLTQAVIIKTTDAGYTWVKADSGIITLEEGLFVLEMDPQNPDTLYTGTAGLFGGKPYKSTNGGESWFRIDPDSLWIWAHTLCGDSIFFNGYPLREGITAIAIDPASTNIVYVGTAFFGEIYKSTDGGINWVLTCLPQVGIVYDIEIDPMNTERIYCGAWGYGFFKSSDAGFSWENMNTGLSDTVSVKKIETNYFQGNLNMFIIAHQRDSGGIYTSINNSSWEKIGIDEKYINTIELFDVNLYAGGDGIYVKQVLTNVDENVQPPISARLYSNYPNPFNSVTVIEYEIKKEGNVIIEIFDVLGKKVKTLVHKHHRAGKYSVYWNGKDEKGNTLSSGVYLYILRVEGYMIVKKMIYLR